MTPTVYFTYSLKAAFALISFCQNYKTKQLLEKAVQNTFAQKKARVKSWWNW